MSEKKDFSFEQVTENTPNLVKRFKVSFDKKDIKNKIDTVLSEKASKARKNGFQNSSNITIPYSLVERKHKKQVEGEVIKDKIQEIMLDIMQSCKERVIGQPDIKNLIHEKDQDIISFEVEFEVLPEMQVPDFSKVVLDHFVIEISDEEVEESLNNIKKAGRSFQDDFDGKNAKEGDKVTIDLSIFGEEGKVYIKDVKDIKFDIASGMIDVDFEKHFLSCNKEESKTFDFTFPKDFSMIKDIGGKKVSVKAYIKDIKRYKDMQSVEETVARYGCDSIEELKYRIRDLIRADFLKEIFMIHRSQLIRYLKSNLDFDIPPTLLKGEKERIRKMKTQMAKIKQLHQGEKKYESEEVSDKEVEEEALQRARSSMILAECVNKYNIKVTQEEFEEYVKSELEGHNTSEEKKKILKKCEETKDAWTAFTLEQKSIKYIIERQVNLREKFVTTDEIKEIIKSESVELMNNL